MVETTRRVSVTLPETLARLSKSQAALAGQTYEQFIRDTISDRVQRLIKEPAPAS